jgi:hypothetical protein
MSDDNGSPQPLSYSESSDYQDIKSIETEQPHLDGTEYSRLEIAVIYISFTLICPGLFVGFSSFDFNSGWHLAVIWFLLILGGIGLIYSAVISIKRIDYPQKGFWIGALSGSVAAFIPGLFVAMLGIISIVNTRENLLSVLGEAITGNENWVDLIGLPIYCVANALFIGLPAGGLGGFTLGSIRKNSTAALMGGVIPGFFLSWCSLFLYIMAF